ncbi:FG-GAP repeat domain-containing protein [Gilvimarinus sp. F26214L]|uniref:FG-GAP repeat domain-containing protein n=1 Tax=Gilvimarinus sp. DZF01 TaxID=3461371 RepID=UPI0040457102
MNNQRAITRFSTFVLSFSLAALTQADGGLSNYQRVPFELNGVSDRIIPADMNGDGLVDLLTADGSILSLYLQRPGQSPFDFANPDARLELPGNATGWGLDQERLLALVEGRKLLSWTVSEDGFGEPDTELDALSGFLPSGAYPLDFVRDINGDGRADIIVPGPNELQLYLQNPAGGYEGPVHVQSRIMNYSRLLPGAYLDSRVGQSVRIPQLQIRDVNNDQRPDLVTSSEERIDVFLASDKGSFASVASYSVNLQELSERVGEVDFDRVDFGNLSGLLAHTYDVQLEDVDGDGIEDLLIREGGKLTVFAGAPEGMNMEQPRQVLKSGGNVLGTFVRDEDEDGLGDLWLSRIEDISLANLFLWLAVSGSVDIETFIYRNEGKRFASRPHRKITVSVKFPPILRSADLVSAAVDPDQNSDVPRSARAQLDAPDSAQELAVLRRNAVAIFMNAIRGGESDAVLGLADYSRSKNRYVLDLGKALENTGRGMSGDLQKVSGREADFEISYLVKTVKDGEKEEAPELSTMDLVSWELNGDGRHDFFVLTERNDNQVRGVMLLSR